MKDVEEFKKLFKINIPMMEHFDYYIDTLVKSPFYSGLKNSIKDFEKYESDADFLGYKSSISYKLDYAFPKLFKHITESDAYKKLVDADLSKGKLRRRDILNHHDDSMLLSIDFSKANFNALKTYDSKGELRNTWEDLCWELSIHPVLVNSKSFRQYVFGKTIPKKLERVQHQNIIKIIDCLVEDYNYSPMSFVFISHDEMVIHISDEWPDMIARLAVVNSDVAQAMVDTGVEMPTHFKLFKNKFIKKNIYVQTIFQIKGNNIVEQYKKLFKISGHKFYKYFKTHILNEELDKRDLLFVNDNDIAVWAEEDDTISEIVTPEGEMSLEEVEKEYPFFVNKLKKEVTGLSDSQIRKVINVTMDICVHCHNAEIGCHCWNDE